MADRSRLNEVRAMFLRVADRISAITSPTATALLLHLHLQLQVSEIRIVNYIIYTIYITF